MKEENLQLNLKVCSVQELIDTFPEFTDDIRVKVEQLPEFTFEDYVSCLTHIFKVSQEEQSLSKSDETPGNTQGKPQSTNKSSNQIKKKQTKATQMKEKFSKNDGKKQSESDDVDLKLTNSSVLAKNINDSHNFLLVNFKNELEDDLETNGIKSNVSKERLFLVSKPKRHVFTDSQENEDENICENTGFSSKRQSGKQTSKHLVNKEKLKKDHSLSDEIQYMENSDFVTFTAKLLNCKGLEQYVIRQRRKRLEDMLVVRNYSGLAQCFPRSSLGQGMKFSDY